MAAGESPLSCLAFITVLSGFVVAAAAQVLPLPSRLADAAGGTEFARSISGLPPGLREERIAAEILRGNVPASLRRLQPVTLRDGTNVILLHVTPDYLAVGSEDDSFLTPMTSATAQRIADATGCALPTRKLVDVIHASAPLKLVPAPLPPSQAMTSVEVFARHNAIVRAQRLAHLEAHPAGTLVAGHKKDVVITPRLTSAPGRVAIYGWHKPDRKAIQPLYLGHADSWVDYSHGIRLVQSALSLDGTSNTVQAVLADALLARVLSDEGAIKAPRYPMPSRFVEDVTEFKPFPDVRVVINAPPAVAFTPGKPVKLLLYALPNGSSIEQTAGRRLRPGDDWRFDIQHIAAQTRWLRAADTNHLWVIAYLEAAGRSWPAWRQQHTNSSSLIHQLVGQLTARYSNHPARLVLTGHSGGGSFTFGYLNSVEAIPDHIERIGFLDSNYAYDPAQGHAEKLVQWLQSSPRHHLTVLAYDDANALLDGKPFVSATGGTWYRSHQMRTNLSAQLSFSTSSKSGLEISTALDGRVQFLLKPNSERRIYHTVQVEKNGFIHAMLTGTVLEGAGYEYFGPRAYQHWLDE